MLKLLNARGTKKLFLSCLLVSQTLLPCRAMALEQCIDLFAPPTIAINDVEDFLDWDWQNAALPNRELRKAIEKLAERGEHHQVHGPHGEMEAKEQHRRVDTKDCEVKSEHEWETSMTCTDESNKHH